MASSTSSWPSAAGRTPANTLPTRYRRRANEEAALPVGLGNPCVVALHIASASADGIITLSLGRCLHGGASQARRAHLSEGMRLLPISEGSAKLAGLHAFFSRFVVERIDLGL